MNIILVLSLLVAGCSVTLGVRKWPMKDGVPCTCSRLHDPVCASDGQDYPNRDCARNCGKVRSFVRGYCDQPALCGCPYDIATVCARRPDGTLDEFVNRCQAECQNGAVFVSNGHCPARPIQPLPDLFVEQLRELRSLGEEREKKAACICPAIYSPVCGLKNRIWRNYASQCNANCAGVKTTKPGTCRSKRSRSCPCGRIYLPVCARKPDGTLRDYNNDCLARCEDAVIVNTARCAARPDNSLPGFGKRSSEPACVCTRIYSPVCAESYGDRKVYSNKCVAECNNATYIQDGDCNGPALLPVFPDRHPVQLPVFPNDTDDSVIDLLPWTPEDSDDSDDLEAVHLPYFSDDSDDPDDDQQQYFPDDSDDDSDLFSSLFKRMLKN